MPAETSDVCGLSAVARVGGQTSRCLLYTSDAADERSSVDLGGRRIIKKKTNEQTGGGGYYSKHVPAQEDMDRVGA